MLRWMLGAILVASSVSRVTAGPPDLPDGTEAARARIAAFKVPAGLTVELFAAEPRLASPVAIGLDERNRVYVAEEYRFNLGTEENRTRPFLLEDDLQIETLDDRLRMFEKHATRFDGGMEWFRKVSDQVRLVEDTNGDGVADRSTVFAPGFNGVLDGMAAGVMARDGDIYFTCVPNLWRLRDTDQDGVADTREVLLTGFGVNAAFLGHDLHGLCWGPDGRLYFSIGDRGFHVTTREGTVLHGPRTGAVFRCEPDGRHLEVVMRGLRNPQEIAFDQFGNLFAADNNCDKGDHSRLELVLEGADSGWNMAYQTLAEPYLTGPWHAEKMWHLWSLEIARDPEHPAWILPPVGPLGAGPSGFTFNPGNSLPGDFANRFFLCNYTGNGGIETFRVEPRGAGFSIADPRDFLKPVSATDCEFGYDGKLYVSDFVNLIWNGGSSGGRIYTVSDAQAVRGTSVQETAALFREGFRARTDEELARLLGHPDQRVRQRSQFELVERPGGLAQFTSVVNGSGELLPRLHAVWGLGQLSRREEFSGAAIQEIKKRLDDRELEIRAHAVRILGESGPVADTALVTRLLTDESPRVRQFTALALARARQGGFADTLVGQLREFSDDPWLRHGVVRALAVEPDLRRFESDPSVNVRLGILLAHRQQLVTATTGAVPFAGKLPTNATAAILRFLGDADWKVVTEAARALHDFPMVGREALANLGSVILPGSHELLPDALLRRVVYANVMRGGEASLANVVAVAESPRASIRVRRDALAALNEWIRPAPRDRVMGHWIRESRPPAPDLASVQKVLGERLPTLLATTPAELQPDLVRLIETYQLSTDEAQFAGWVTDDSRSVVVRNAALRLLASRRSPHLAASLDAALASKDPLQRAEARDVLVRIDATRGIRLLGETWDDPAATLLEKQRAVTVLGGLKIDLADAIVQRAARQLADGQVDPAARLDVMEAVAQRALPDSSRLLEQFQSQLGNEPLARFQVALVGGEASRGRELLRGHRVAQCLRCHRVLNPATDSVIEAGGTAGPNLFGVAKRLERAGLLQSLIDPNAQIARGFETVTLTLANGRTLAGVVREETATLVTIEQPDGTRVSVPAAEIEERSRPQSAMPDLKSALSIREIRDLVEFLSTLKE